MCYCALQPWSIRTKLKSLKSLSIISIVLGTLLNSVHPIHHRQPLLNSLAPEGKKRKHYMQKLAVMLMQRVYNLLSVYFTCCSRQTKRHLSQPFSAQSLKIAAEHCHPWHAITKRVKQRDNNPLFLFTVLHLFSPFQPPTQEVAPCCLVPSTASSQLHIFDLHIAVCLQS